MTRIRRLGKVAAFSAAVLSLLLSLATMCLWIRSCRVADLWWRRSTWDTTSHDHVIYHQRSLLVTSAEGALRFQIDWGDTMHPARRYEGRPQRVRRRQARAHSFFYPFPGPPPFGERSTRMGWEREHPDDELLQRSNTASERLLGFYYLRSEDDPEQSPHDASALVGFPHWSLAAVFLILPVQLAFGKIRPRSSPPAPADANPNRNVA